MTHFTVIVLGDDHEKLLEPYDENLAVEPYVAGDHEEALEEIERARKVLADPANAERWLPHPSNPNDEDAVLRWWSRHDWRRNADGKWERWSTYSPKGRWDWYQVGGRWSGAVPTFDRDQGTVADLLVGGKDGKPFRPSAIVCPDGTWHERGRMGWWGEIFDEKSEGVWAARVAEIYTSVPGDTKAVLIDAHI